ncbi:MAG: Sua5/YciO/YrdC/YwlC family protein, partial [Angelakisella sp.]
MLTILDTERDHKAIATAGELLRSGGTVIIPTETVYGLAANACDPIAVAKIFEAKGRPQDNPLIVHIDSMDMLPPLVTEVSAAALLLAERFWPGPLT